METDDSGPQLEICFVTKQDIYAVPGVPFSVPQNINIVHLNKLLNELLGDYTGQLKAIKFDFLVNGQILRLPLIDHLREFNISTETTIDVEYIERTEAPEPENALIHDDWIGGVQAADKWILTGCYDYSVNIWTVHGKHEAISQEHTNLVKAVSWLKQSDPEGGFVTVSHDLTGMLWMWKPGDKSPSPVIVLRGHERGIDSVGVSPNSERLATGGWDTYLKIWSASLDADENYEPHHKKIKSSSHLPSRTPIHTLQGHKENVVSVQWLEPQLICTASMDHTIKLWDTELGGLQSEIVAEKAFLGASWSPLCRSIIACSADRHVRLYDPRSTEGSVCKMIFTSHSLWVSAITWSQTDEHLFMSGSYDECVKLWDTRCPKAPLYDLSGHQGKVLCVDWTNPKHLVSGGTDNSVHIFKNRHNN
ncbi:hypothetical protein PPYR_08682 [Photinus pyralis]|uniref:Ribosome biogenesis protein WDR12 homolog n=1 Tax=Photinus pyralis TaxID=7054 RepID=A0A5N4AK51_PHOPY|nr:ribosome biogenesis protein WDR12 homolog [Photinus pyralis]KAB0797689.1 hypothetical protein PPYR_08682 [Photinus pyralis]